MPKTLMAEIATFIKQKRTALAISQGDLAESLYGIRRRATYISDIENGRKEININTLEAILTALKSWIRFIDVPPGMIDESEGLMPQLASFIKLKRQALGISQAELSEKIYGSPHMTNYFSDIENNRKDISVKSAGFILEALNSWIEFIE